MNQYPTIDVHAHVLTLDMIALLQREAPVIGPELSDVDARGATLRIGEILQRPYPRGGWDIDVRLRDMDEHGIDMQVLSVLPQTLLYDQDPSLTAVTAALQNEALSSMARQWPDRFMAIGTVPLQAPESAAAELYRCMLHLGLRGVMIGSHVGGNNLDDPGLEPFWAAAEELGAFILIHPQKVMGGRRLEPYYLRNLIGNPLETTIAAASLVFGGVMDRHPRLKICLSHGGGYVPYQTGRFNHGWAVRPESKAHLGEAPEASIRRFYFDTILHFEPSLTFLVKTFGPSQVLLGSDYPFDMGMFNGVQHVRGLPLPEQERDSLLGRSAWALLAKNGEAESPQGSSHPGMR